MDFVRFVQTALRDRGHAIEVDGIAGEQTRTALLAALGPMAAGPAGEWDARSAKNLVGVHPDLLAVMNRAQKDSPLPFMVIEGLRTIERQRQLVASGASQTLRSRHLTGHAVDIVPLDPKGQVSWDWPLYDKLSVAVKHAAASLSIPIEWGGDWRTFKDGPHWQLPWAKYP